MRHLIFTILTITYTVLSAQIDSTEKAHLDPFDLSMEELLGITVEEKSDFKLYGFINSNIEKVFQANHTLDIETPVKFSPIKNFHLYGQGKLAHHINILFNLSANETGFELRNAYGEIKLWDALWIRAGKSYRNFGLYNDKLDQVPTFIGIEAPELFDTDHLFLSRTSDFMLHGLQYFRSGTLFYSLTTGNSEGNSLSNVTPIGADIRFKSEKKELIIGSSAYTSNIFKKASSPSNSYKKQSSHGGILPWMKNDKYQVYGGFIEKKIGQFLIQTEYWISPHKGRRDPIKVIDLIQNSQLTQNQINKLTTYDNPSKDYTEMPATSIIEHSNYVSQTFYVRCSYIFNSNKGQFIPYLFLDWMSNPEMIANPTFGGDNEAGLADNGTFTKPSIGLLYRPINEVAIKLDGSLHSQLTNNSRSLYPEIRLDFSFSFNALERLTKID